MLFGCLGLLFLALATHPFVTYPLSLMMFSRRRPMRTRDDPRPSVAICMSAYNEAAVIVAKIESLLALAEDYGPATIHVFVDGASDGTAERLAPYADRIDLHVSTARRGKTAGLNQLVAASASDLLLFTDANVVLKHGAIVDLTAPFADPTVGCASARLEYVNAGETPTSSAGATYWRLEESIKQLESETLGLIGVDGAFFMIRRALYQPAPDYLIDDLYVSLKVLVQRARVISVPDVRVAERSAANAFEEMRRKTRIACQAINVNRALRREIAALPLAQRYAYVSHRILRWATPFTGSAALLCFAIALWIHFGWSGLAVPLALAVLVLLGAVLRIGPCMMISSAVLSLYGVGRGVIEGLFTKRTYTVWTPAASVRRVP